MYVSLECSRLLASLTFCCFAICILPSLSSLLVTLQIRTNTIKSYKIKLSFRFGSFCFIFLFFVFVLLICLLHLICARLHLCVFILADDEDVDNHLIDLEQLRLGFRFFLSFFVFVVRENLRTLAKEANDDERENKVMFGLMACFIFQLSNEKYGLD